MVIAPVGKSAHIKAGKSSRGLGSNPVVPLHVHPRRKLFTTSIPLDQVITFGDRKASAGFVCCVRI